MATIMATAVVDKPMALPVRLLIDICISSFFGRQAERPRLSRSATGLMEMCEIAQRRHESATRPEAQRADGGVKSTSTKSGIPSVQFGYLVDQFLKPRGYLRITRLD